MQKRTGQGLTELREAIKHGRVRSVISSLQSQMALALHFKNEIGFGNKTVSTTNL